MREPSGIAERRHHAHRIIDNRLRLHLATRPYDCRPEVCYYCGHEQRRALSHHPFSCNCRRRRRGRPKIAGGMCRIGIQDRILLWRKQARNLNLNVTQGGYLSDSDEATFLDEPKTIITWE